MRVPTLSAVRELDFIESPKSEGMTYQCRVKSVNAIVTRGRHHMCAQLLFQRWTLRAAIFVAVTFLSAVKRDHRRRSSCRATMIGIHVSYDPPPSAVLSAFSRPVST